VLFSPATASNNSFSRSSKVLDFSTDTPSLELTSSVQTSGTANDIAIVDSYALIADGEAWLQVVDVSDPYAPEIIGWGITFDNAYAVTSVADLAFIAIGASGLQISDISDPTDPALISSLDTPGLSLGVAVNGSIACVADYTAGLQLIDIANPLCPHALGTVNTPGYAHDVNIVESDTHRLYALVADGIAGLQVVDISRPTTPTIIGALDTPGYASSLTVKGNTVYLADGFSDYVFAIDISNPTSPNIINAYNVAGNVKNVCVDRDILYVTTQDAGLLMLDLSSDTGARLGHVDTPGEGKSIVPLRDWMLVAAGSEGLQITPRLSTF